MKNKGQEAVQGDVVITSIKGLPKGVVAISKRPLAYGEATGHAHKVLEDDIEMFQDPKNQDLYMRALKEVKVVHEEHKAVTIRPGTYKIGIVREYDYFMEEARKVID